MDHLSLSKQFNSVAYDLVNNSTTIGLNIPSLKDEEILRRIVFSRFYYSLYHKCLAHDSDLSSRTGPGIHAIMLDKIKNSNDRKLYQVFNKTLNLRIWADYKFDKSPHSLNVNLNTHKSDVWSIVNRKNISC